MECEIRAVRPQDWPCVKSFRLAALRDPLSPIAFKATYDLEAALPDEEWQRRAAGTSFVALDTSADADAGANGGTGEWVGLVTVLMETGEEYPVPQTHVVGMYVSPGHRGSGVAERLLRTAVGWSWEQPEVERVRLWVTEANDRAYAFYRRAGFTGTGKSARHPPRPEIGCYELMVPRPLG